LNITFVGQYGSVKDITWEGVPPFAVLTGRNGVGKTQLLEVLAATYDALPENPQNEAAAALRGPRHGKQSVASATIDGATFKKGEVFHSYSTWTVLGGGSASPDQIRQRILSVRGPWRSTDPPWIATEVARRAGVAVDLVKTLTDLQLEEFVTPYLLWGQSLPAFSTNLAFLFLAYRIFEDHALKNGKSASEVRTLYGEAPWDVLNAIFTAASLPFKVISPQLVGRHSLFELNSYELRLVDTDEGRIIPLNMLSSGERVIMSTALWRFGVTEVGRHYKLLLLDEPDAHLHPSMTRRFLDVIQRIFVEEHGVQVIMTTHSPSTVALVPESSLFEMRRVQPRIQPAISREAMIADLTDGFVVVHEGMRVVFCEGIHDSPFYEMVWERLTETEVLSRPINPRWIPLARTPPLVFMHGKGIDTITAIIPQLRAAGLSHFHGLIDLDDSNARRDGIHVIARRALENYLFDPISIWCLLHNEDRHPAVDGINVPRGQRAVVTRMNDNELQSIADKVLSMVRAFLSVPTPDENRIEVSFITGKCLHYPAWFLHSNKDVLMAAFKRAFPRLLKDSYDELVTSFATLDMIPTDLAELMRAIQQPRGAKHRSATPDGES